MSKVFHIEEYHGSANIRLECATNVITTWVHNDLGQLPASMPNGFHGKQAHFLYVPSYSQNHSLYFFLSCPPRQWPAAVEFTSHDFHTSTMFNISHQRVTNSLFTHTLSKPLTRARINNMPNADGTSQHLRFIAEFAILYAKYYLTTPFISCDLRGECFN